MILRRVSSAEQADRYGLDAQRAACVAFARAEGLAVVADFSEDARSTTLLDERPAGRAALDAMLQHGAGTLLLARRDRLARDPFVAGHAKRAVAIFGGRIQYAEGGNGQDDSGLLLDDIQHAIAAHERRAIVARLRQGREAKRAADPHAYVGGRPAYGYRADPLTRELAVEPEAADVVRSIFARARRGQPVRRIAADLTAEGAGARRWHPTQVARILAHEPYKRQRPGRIVDPKLYNAARRALQARQRTA